MTERGRFVGQVARSRSQATLTTSACTGEITKPYGSYA
jgi:hypothetical protein